MYTLIYYWLTRWLDSWEDEPLASCIGLCIFVIADVYVLSCVLQWLLGF